MLRDIILVVTRLVVILGLATGSAALAQDLPKAPVKP